MEKGRNFFSNWFLPLLSRFMFSVLHLKSKHVEHFMFLQYKTEIKLLFVFFPSVVGETSPWTSAASEALQWVSFPVCGSPQMGVKGLTSSELKAFM